MTHKYDKQSQSLAEANVSPSKTHVISCDCSIFCIKKWNHQEWYISSEAASMEI